MNWKLVQLWSDPNSQNRKKIEKYAFEEANICLLENTHFQKVLKTDKFFPALFSIFLNS